MENNITIKEKINNVLKEIKMKEIINYKSLIKDKINSYYKKYGKEPNVILINLGMYNRLKDELNLKNEDLTNIFDIKIIESNKIEYIELY